MELHLSQIYPISNPGDYKLHLASRARNVEPLDLFVHEPETWEEWNKYKKHDDFSRDFIFALIDFWPEKDRWLFGGAWQIHNRKYRKYKHGYWEYDIRLVEACKPFIGRLKVALKRSGRVKAVYFEKYYSKLVVTEILPTPYAGEVFCGLDKIDIEFSKLADIIRRQQADWKIALENVKGIYLITDTRNEKRYVGSAYGEGGVWSRWASYTETGHGYTDELTKIISKRGLAHAQKHFRFTLLEHYSKKTENDIITDRETYWKNVLRTRECGYNRN
jgi:hypothetical protein